MPVISNETEYKYQSPVDLSGLNTLTLVVPANSVFEGTFNGVGAGSSNYNSILRKNNNVGNIIARGFASGLAGGNLNNGVNFVKLPAGTYFLHVLDQTLAPDIGASVAIQGAIYANS